MCKEGDSCAAYFYHVTKLRVRFVQEDVKYVWKIG